MSRLILVLGCHRSGTSLVANSMPCLGAELGPRANWSGPDNTRGFGEDLDVLTINEAILKGLASSWDSITDLSISAWWAQNVCESPVLPAMLNSRLQEFPTFAMKDPRLCRLLPFWRHALDAVGCEVSIVHVVRHPMAVARSLYKRNGISIEQGLKLWQVYTQNARRHVDPAWPAVTVWYDALMSQPVQQIERMGAALGLTVDVIKTRQFSRDFVDDTLWHETEHVDDALPLEISVLWEMLRNEAMNAG